MYRRREVIKDVQPLRGGLSMCDSSNVDPHIWCGHQHAGVLLLPAPSEPQEADEMFVTIAYFIPGTKFLWPCERQVLFLLCVHKEIDIFWAEESQIQAPTLFTVCCK